MCECEILEKLCISRKNKYYNIIFMIYVYFITKNKNLSITVSIKQQRSVAANHFSTKIFTRCHIVKDIEITCCKKLQCSKCKPTCKRSTKLLYKQMWQT